MPATQVSRIEGGTVYVDCGPLKHSWRCPPFAYFALQVLQKGSNGKVPVLNPGDKVFVKLNQTGTSITEARKIETAQ